MNAIQHIALLCGIVLLGLGVTPGSAWADAVGQANFDEIRHLMAAAESKSAKNEEFGSKSKQKQLITATFGEKSAEMNMRQYQFGQPVRTCLANSHILYSVLSVCLSEKPVKPQNFEHSAVVVRRSTHAENRTCWA